jgi:hypothetical protein
MSKDKTPGDYEVGYGKPPKNTQFQKGASGNLRGRPKKAPDFDHELIKESKSFMTINENGRRKRISKHEVVIKQLTKLAMTGSPQALRIYFDRHQQALERAALVAGPQPNHSGKDDDPRNLTDEQLEWLIFNSLQGTEWERKKGHISSTG